MSQFFKELRRELGGERFPYVWVPEWHPGGHGLHVHFALGHFVRQAVLRDTWGRADARLLNAAETPRDRVALLFLLDLGVRRSELAGVRPIDIDLSRRQVTVFGKGQKSRVIPLRGRIILEIERYLMEPCPYSTAYRSRTTSSSTRRSAPPADDCSRRTRSDA